jgi:hypothetical protein
MATTQQSKNTTQPTFETAFEQVKEINEQVLEATRKASVQYLDSYEKAVDRAVDFELKLAGATKQEWLKTLVDAQADMTRELTEAYTKAARSLLA